MTLSVEVVRKFAPVVVFHPNETWFPCSFPFLLQGGTLHGGAAINGRGGIIPPMPNLTEARFNDILARADPRYDFFIDVNPSQYGGMAPDGPTPPPMYYAIQEFEDCVEITYMLLFAYQGGQTAIADRKGSSFRCIINSYGQHQGDLEEFRVQLVAGPDGTYSATEIAFEAHGDFTAYGPQDVSWEGSHPVVHCALSGHSLHNFRDHGEWHSEASQSGMLDIGSAMGNGRRWDGSRPAVALIRLGLDAAGNVIGDQLWSKFKGRLGREDAHSLTGATHFDGRGLSSPDWSFVQRTEGFIRSFAPSKLEKYATGIGPTGPGDRAYIRPGDGAPRRRAEEQVGWLRCRRCGGLYFPAGGDRCPAGGPHDGTGSRTYALPNGSPVRWHAQSNWRWCHKCSALHYAVLASVCPAGGRHETGGSASYWLCASEFPTALGTDGRLGTNQPLLSANKHFIAVMQPDGNLVVTFHGATEVLWASNSAAQPPGACVLVNQADGNLVIYNEHNGAVVWQAGTGGRPKGPTTLVMQDDGNLVKYGPGGPVWAAGVSRPERLAETDWRWCAKCGGAHLGHHPSVCPAGGSHILDGSGNYAVCHL